MTSRIRIAALATCTLPLLALTGCGDDDTSRARTVPSEGSVDPTNAGGDVVDVVLRDFSFAGLPEEVEAGTVVRVTNESATELHELVAVRIPDEEERPVSELLQLPPEELAGIVAGPPALLVLAPPGADPITVVGDGSLDTPGRYAIVCFIPTGADPDAYLEASRAAADGPPQVEGGAPHVAHGMFAELIVG